MFNAVGECGLWSLPDRLPACVRVSEVVLDGLLGGFIRIMPVKHLNTERGAALTVNVCYWFHTSLYVGPQGRWVREKDALCGAGNCGWQGIQRRVSCLVSWSEPRAALLAS